MGKIEVFIQKLSDDVIIPTYADEWDSGMDIRSTIDVDIHPHEIKIIPTGLKMAIPNGYEIQVRPRSGLSAKTHLRISNTPGTIDAKYRNEIGIIIENNGQFIETIEKGDRIAQIVLAEVPRMILTEIDDINQIEGNRGGGFGHTGLK